MAYVEMICLANSRKRGGRCVAGIRTDGRGWVRPVAPYEDGALYGQHYTLDDGSQAQVLDVLMVDIGAACPEPHQPENYVVGQGTWKLVARPAGPEVITVIGPHVERGPSLLGSETHRVSAQAFLSAGTRASLALVAPRQVTWEVRTGTEGRRHVRARFRVGDVMYDLGVTDPELERRLDNRQEGLYRMRSADGDRTPQRFLLTISLSENFNGFHYKLVAGVIAIPRAWGRST